MRPRQKRHVLARAKQVPRQIAAQNARAKYQNFHIKTLFSKSLYPFLASFRYSMGRRPVLFLKSSAKRLDVV